MGAASAAAFAPSAQVSRSSVATNMAFESELGVQPPLGFFDPLGLLNDADQERFDRLRYVELKHGRISQLAFLGNIITRAGIHLPGDFRNESLDFGWDTFDEETKLQKRAIELNNGRAAQFGILGLMVHEQLGGSIPIVGEM